jgi:hypothetical protein
MLGLLTDNKLVDREANVTRNLPQQRRGDIAARMQRHRRAAPIRVPELYV